MDMKVFQKQVQDMQFTFLDNLRKPNDSLVFEVRDQLQRLEHDVETRKNVTTIRERLQNLRSLIKDASEREVVSFEDADSMLDWIDDSIRNVR